MFFQSQQNIRKIEKGLKEPLKQPTWAYILLRYIEISEFPARTPGAAIFLGLPQTCTQAVSSGSGLVGFHGLSLFPPTFLKALKKTH